MSTSISNLPRSRDEVLVEMLRVNLDRSGADPSEFFDSLAAAVMHRVWELRGMTFLEFLKAPFPDGVGVEIDLLQKLLKIEHRSERRLPEVRERMTMLREEVERLVAVPLRPNGANQYSVGSNNITPSTRGTDPQYTVARLLRDRPDLAESVLAGDMTANQAAIEAGFRRKTATVPADPQGIARWARKHFTAEQIAELVEALR